MEKTKTKEDENYEKPSKHKMWHERSARPIASRVMTKIQIEEHRLNLVRSYKCRDDEITFDFQKIMDENDEDRDDCLLLIYEMKCVVASKPVVREVFTIKLPIPDEIRKMAEAARKNQAPRRRRRGAAPAQPLLLTAAADTPVEEPQVGCVSNIGALPALPPVMRPKLRRPIVRPPVTKSTEPTVTAI